MESVAARPSAKYRVVIPKAVRDALNLEPDSMLLFLIEGGRVTIRPQPASWTGALRGLHKELWSEPEAWLERERSTDESC